MNGRGEHLRKRFSRAFEDCAHEQTVPESPPEAVLRTAPSSALRGGSLAEEGERLSLVLFMPMTLYRKSS